MNPQNRYNTPMGNFTGHTIYVGPKVPRLLKAPKNLKIDSSLCQTFRQTLLKDHESFTVQINLTPFPMINCNFAVCGQTAGVANWWRDKTTEAITAFLTGVDEDDEYLVELALAYKPYPISLHRWHDLLKAKRPLYATFLLTPTSVENRVIATAASALAASFFSNLGVG